MKLLRFSSFIFLFGLLWALGDSQETANKKKPYKILNRNKHNVRKIVSLVSDVVFTERNERDGLFKLSTIPQKVFNETTLGVSQIIYYKEGQICSGTHLTPWILLTAASCVKGRELERLYVRVLYRDGDSRYKRIMPVRVHSVDIHPRYNPSRPDFDLAVVTVYAKYQWDVGQFFLPRKNYVFEDIQNKGYPTTTDEMHQSGKPDYKATFTIRTYETKMIKDFEKCNELAYVPNWYCVDKGFGKSTFKKMDIGSPFFFKTDYDIKRVIGIYSGRSLDKDLSAHIFENVFLGKEFIESIMQRYPMPPFW